MQVPEDLLYTKTHEWARRAGGEVAVGITSHAQEELRDVVFVELPAVAKSPQLVNQDCYGGGWLYAITPSAPKELESLLPADAYTKQIQASTH